MKILASALRIPPGKTLAPPARMGLPAAVACAAVLALALVLRVAWFPVADRSPDELLWTSFGSHVAESGPGWIQDLARRFAHEEDVEYPWPHRSAWVCLLGLVMRVSGRHDVTVGESVSLAASVLMIALTGLIALRYLGGWSAALAMLFLAVSPLDLALARRCWQDDLMALVTLVMAACVLRSIESARRGRWFLAFFAVSAVALLVKESAAIPFGLGTLVLAWHGARTSRRASGALLPLAAGALTALASGLALVALCGGWSTMLKVYELAREYTAPDDYMREYQTGGIGYYLTGLGLLQPLPWLLGGIGAVLALAWAPRLARTARHPLAARALGTLAIFVAGFGVVSFSYFSKNMRFLSPIYAPVALLAAATVSEGLGSARERLPRPAGIAALVVAVAGLLAAALLDAKRFDHYFNEIQIQDLATPWFTKANAGKL